MDSNLARDLYAWQDLKTYILQFRNTILLTFYLIILYIKVKKNQTYEDNKQQNNQKLVQKYTEIFKEQETIYTSVYLISFGNTIFPKSIVKFLKSISKMLS